MNKHVATLICMICFGVAVSGLYFVKYAVQGVQRDVASLQTELKGERESLHLLNAEWAYLNRPERLHALSEKHLALAPLDSRQIQEIGVLPAAYDGAGGESLIHPVAAR
jgi:hypothetical protein